MRRRVPQHLLKRLHGVEKRRRSKRNRPFMLVPRRLSMDEWTKMAAESQAVLKKHVTSDEDGPPKYNKEHMKIMTPVRRIY